jgi:hypothetical protein
MGVVCANVYQSLGLSFGLQKGSMMEKGTIKQGKPTIKVGATKVLGRRKVLKHIHTVEVRGSNPRPPTRKIKGLWMRP